MDQTGFVSYLDWLKMDPADLSAEELSIMGSGGSGYGAYLVK